MFLKEQTTRPFHAAITGKENAHTAVSSLRHAQVEFRVWVCRVFNVYLVRDIPQLLTILGLEPLLDLLAAPHHCLVELLLHDVAATSGYHTTCGRRPVDLLRLIPGRASLNTSRNKR